MTYFHDIKEVIHIIEKRKNRGYGIEHFKEYMHSINNPHLKLSAIHVAGTNGKGSTTNDLRSILQEGGYRVGTFTSPYMITHLDRIRINDEYILEEKFLNIVNAYYDSWMTWDLSMFEIDMCIACIYFLEEHVDICVFEVGLGGRLDFTNILHPIVSLITNIGLDHMELLGDTYEKIAMEKAGIIKKGKPCITGEKKAECLRVFERKCEATNSALYVVGNIGNIQMEEDTVYFDYQHLSHISLASAARYQCYNAALAIETILYLRKHHEIMITDAQIKMGLKKAFWIGRYEIIQKDPFIILDGAHNADGIQALCESLQTIDNPIIIFSVLRDKNFEEMLFQLQKISDYIMVCPLHNDRALNIHALAKRQGIYVKESFDEAMKLGREMQRAIVITGSLYFISEVRARLIK